MTATDESSSAAQQKLNTAMSAVVKAVRGLDLKGSSIQTQQLSLSPQYKPQARDGRENENENEIIGYNATSTVAIRVGDPGQIGRIIDAGIKAGANRVNGVVFNLRDSKDARREALMGATRDARDQADAIATALAARIGRVVEATVGQPQVIETRRSYGRMSAAAMQDMSSSPAVVEAGDIEVHATVTVVYALDAGGPGAPADRPPPEGR